MILESKRRPGRRAALLKISQKRLRSGKSKAASSKTARFGYDGKGQIFHKPNDDIHQNWEKLKTDEAVIEGIIDFELEISVIIARDLLGQSSAYPAVQNEHKNHILHRTIAPAPVGEDILRRADEMAHHLAEAIDLVGVLALELFVTKDGQLIANEIAPRPA